MLEMTEYMSTRHFDRSGTKWSEVEKSTTNEQPVISTEAKRSGDLSEAKAFTSGE